MSTADNTSRVEKAVNTILDGVFKFLTDKAISSIPDAANWVGNKIKEKISFATNDEKLKELLKKELEELSEKELEELSEKEWEELLKTKLVMKLEELFYSCFEDGLKYGEERKENAVVEAMQANGFSVEQIQLILEQARQIQQVSEQKKKK